MTSHYSTAQVSEMLAVPADTIRSWKRRNADKFLTDHHWRNDGNKNAILWTNEGIELLKQLQASGETVVETGGETLETIDETLTVSDSSLMKRYEPLIDMMVDAIAPRLQSQLDHKVISRIQDLSNAKPLTTVECVVILQNLGLEPIELTGIETPALQPTNNEQQE